MFATPYVPSMLRWPHGASCGANQVVVEFGSTWCTHCEEMFPHFLRLSRRHPQNKYVLAQVDYMGDEAKVRMGAGCMRACVPSARTPCQSRCLCRWLRSRLSVGTRVQMIHTTVFSS